MFEAIAALAIILSPVATDAKDLAADVADATASAHLHDAATGTATPFAPSSCHAGAVTKAQKAYPRSKGVRVLWIGMDSYAGFADADRRYMVLDSTVACKYIATVFVHEAAHQATADLYGGSQTRTDKALGRKAVEEVADCVSAIVSKRNGFTHYTPYLDGTAPGFEGNNGECPAGLKALAEKLSKG